MDVSSSWLVLSTVESGLLISPSKAFFISVTVFLISIFPYDSFFQFPLVCYGRVIFEGWVWSFSGLCHLWVWSCDGLVSSDHACCILKCLIISSEKTGPLKDTEASRPLVWGLCLPILKEMTERAHEPEDSGKCCGLLDGCLYKACTRSHQRDQAAAFPQH